ncbi:MAG: DNA-binding domain-containing protein [Betaproteobacteria bacterium]
MIVHSHDSLPALASFQDDFARALFDPDGLDQCAPAVAALVRQPGFAVYRNTVMKGGIDALQANYPCVARIVGEDWFRSVAALYVRAHPPRQPTLVDYGDRLAPFLGSFEPARELPYLAGVAQLDRFWTEAHVARDEAPVDPRVLAALPPQQMLDARLRPVASARWAWFDECPVFTIWQRNRATGPFDDSEIDWHAEGALLVRVEGVVRWLALDGGMLAFVAACADGGTVADAVAATLEVAPQADPCRVLCPLLEIGAFACPALAQQHGEEPR